MPCVDRPSLAQIQHHRDRRFRRLPELKVHNEGEALAFLNSVGLAFLFGAKGVTMPTLWGAIAGSHRPPPAHHDDPDLGRAWDWKDTLPARRDVFYGALIRGKPTFVSRALLPAAYALSPNYGDPLDYLEHYEAGLLSVEARRIYEVLLNQGAMATSLLRQAAGLAGGGAVARRFNAALQELQMQLRIAKIGISDASRWGYAYVYDLFIRHYPEVPEEARSISTDAAMEALLLCHLENVAAESENALLRLFRWEPWEWDRLIARLVAREAIVHEVEIEGIRGRACVHAGLLSSGALAKPERR